MYDFAFDRRRLLVKGLTEEWLEEPAPNKNDFNFAEIDKENEEFLQMVFKPDPVTKNPTSEIAYMLSGADEGFKQFLKDRLFNAVPQGALADDPDEAAALVKHNLMTQEEFANVTRDYVVNMLKEQELKSD